VGGRSTGDVGGKGRTGPAQMRVVFQQRQAMEMRVR
jgi:hypothetical protein